MTESIEDYFISLIREHGSVDMADHAFKKAVHEDAELREEYAEWCSAVGSSEKNGFLDFCEEYKREQDSIYDALTDYDEEF